MLLTDPPVPRNVRWPKARRRIHKLVNYGRIDGALPPAEQAVLDLLPRGSHEIALVLGIGIGACNVRLCRLKKRRLIAKVGREWRSGNRM